MSVYLRFIGLDTGILHNVLRGASLLAALPRVSRLDPGSQGCGLRYRLIPVASESVVQPRIVRIAFIRTHMRIRFFLSLFLAPAAFIAACGPKADAPAGSDSGKTS